MPRKLPKKVIEQVEKGNSLSQTINMFLAKAKQENGIPFELKIPNELTQSVMRNVRNNKNIEEVSIDALKVEFQRSKNC